MRQHLLDSFILVANVLGYLNPLLHQLSLTLLHQNTLRLRLPALQLSPLAEEFVLQLIVETLNLLLLRNEKLLVNVVVLFENDLIRLRQQLFILSRAIVRQ